MQDAVEAMEWKRWLMKSANPIAVRCNAFIISALHSGSSSGHVQGHSVELSLGKKLKLIL